jgi:CMP-N,N'-diacetyllegionaminic acid synthase
MYKGKNILALITARGGSKGLPRKNIKLLSGKPLIALTIECARKSEYVDRVVVSTDDEQIAAISRKFHAETPFMRPKSLATSNAKSIDVVLHALDWLKKHGQRYDLLLLLQPTSPLRTPEDIDRAIELLFKKKAKAVVSVSETEHHPYWSNILPKNACMKGFIPRSIMNKVRQELPAFYRLNGAIFLVFSDHLKTHRNFYGKDTYAYIMPRERSVDIDTKIDFYLAEYLLKHDL